MDSLLNFGSSAFDELTHSSVRRFFIGTCSFKFSLTQNWSSYFFLDLSHKLTTLFVQWYVSISASICNILFRSARSSRVVCI
jgi:hypothetical protein